MTRDDKLTVLLAGLVADTGRTLPDAAAARAELFGTELRALAGYVEAHGGKCAQIAGDALVATFTSESDAVGCGMALQDAVWERGRELPTSSRLQLRVAVVKGDVRLDRHGVFGAPVERAGKLVEAAPAGVIVVDDSVRLNAPDVVLDGDAPGTARVRRREASSDAPPFGGQHRQGAVSARPSGSRTVSSMLRSALAPPRASASEPARLRPPVPLLLAAALTMVLLLIAQAGKGDAAAIAKLLSPLVLALAAGWALARHAAVESVTLERIGRAAFLPVLLFGVVAGAKLEAKVVLPALAAGAAMAALGVAGRRVLPALPEVVPDVLRFSLPVLVLAWPPKGAELVTAVFVFCGAAACQAGFEAGTRAWHGLAREPWVWALGLALFWGLVGFPTTHLAKLVGVVGVSAAPLLLASLGAGMARPQWSIDAAKRAGWRLAGGLGIAAFVLVVLEPARSVADALLVAAVAPPARAAGDDAGVATVGLLASLAAVVVLVLART